MSAPDRAGHAGAILLHHVGLLARVEVEYEPCVFVLCSKMTGSFFFPHVPLPMAKPCPGIVKIVDVSCCPPPQPPVLQNGLECECTERSHLYLTTAILSVLLGSDKLITGNKMWANASHIRYSQHWEGTVISGAFHIHYTGGLLPGEWYYTSLRRGQGASDVAHFPVATMAIMVTNPGH